MNIPNALLIVAAAKLRADDNEKKADEAALPGDEGNAVLPDVPLLTPPTPMPGMGGSPFQPGAAVREILSGRTGIVVDGPQGDFGSLTFVKADDDQQGDGKNKKENAVGKMKMM